MQFATDLACASECEFEVLLFDRIRLISHTTCYPQIYRHEPGCSSDSEFVSIRPEYAQLEENIFKSFEYFIAGPEFTRDSDDLAHCNSRFEAYLKANLPQKSTTCGHIFQANEPTYCCRDCAVDSTCVLCRSCFFNGVHVKHKYKIDSSSGSGYCDCGDPEAWVSGVWCNIHQSKADSSQTINDCSTKLNCSDDTITQAKIEIDHLNYHLKCLPDDVVKRAGQLFKPLLNSATFCLMDLIQGTPSTTSGQLSSRYRPKANTSSHSTTINDSSEAVILDDIWMIDDGILASSVDNDRVWDIWPPPYSHIPHISPNEDLVSLQQDSWPRTALKARGVADVKLRALAQLERARNHHPRLFAPHSMRTASDRTAASRAFVVVLYNNEYHNYEQVIKTLRRVLDCTTQQGTHHAVTVNCDGRTALQMNVTVDQASNIASVIMRTSSTLSSRPLYCTAEHADVYTMEVFFTLFLRWLRRYCEQVPSLRPVVCHALLGFFPIMCNLHDVDTQQVEHRSSLLCALPHNNMIKEHSFINSVFQRHTRTWRSVRQEFLCLIMSVLLQDNFYRRVFAVKFTQDYGLLMQNLIYDDHLTTDNICGLSCQLFTVISLARHLLEHNQVLSRIIINLERAFAANSILLPDFFTSNTLSGCDTGANQISTTDCSLTDVMLTNQSDLLNNEFHTPWITSILELLRHVNPVEWGSPSTANSTINRSSHEINYAVSHSSSFVPPQPRVLSWQAGDTLGHTWFPPFERLFHCITDVNYVLASLTNVRPLSSGLYDNNNGWWTDATRSSYLEYIKHLLCLLSFVQDMNGMQREQQNHVSEELEWVSGFYIMNHMISLLGLTVQVSSSDFELYKLVLNEVRQAFEVRVGILDRRFRVKPYTSHSNYPNVGETLTKRLKFHSLGVCTEIYVYDVSVYRLSLLQPLPRLLANLYAHGLEMGLSLENLGLIDHAFVNLLIERPLQVFSFCSQYNAKMWVRNGLAAQQTITNLFSPGMRVELIDRDFQLLQLASCVLSPDEFIVRLIHKFHLGAYLKSESNRESSTYRVHAMEMLLRLILTCVTHRFRPSIGNFTTDYYRQLSEHYSIASDSLEEIILDADLETCYSSLIHDVIHILCLRPLTYSELISALPYQATSSLLLKYNHGSFNVDVIKQDGKHGEFNLNESSGSGQKSKNDILNSSNLLTSRVKPIQKASVSGRANKLSMEAVLPRILKHVATQSITSGRNVFNLKPEIMAYRFNRFHWGYRQSEQTNAEANVCKRLKSWLEGQRKTQLVNFPTPPPPPLPLHRFQPTIYPGPLKLLQCTTFVRLMKALLEVAINSGTTTIHWSDALLDLVLHLILVALYEDEFESCTTGNYPFLQAVHCVPEHMETEDELEQLLLSEHWLKPHPPPVDPLVCFSKTNCLTSRLMKLLQSSHHDDHGQLIRWTLNYWNRLISKILMQSSNITTVSLSHLDAPTDLIPSVTSVREDRALKAKARRARIMARMCNMQQSFMDTYTRSLTNANEIEMMDLDMVEYPGAGSSSTIISHADTVAALGPSRALGILVDLADPDFSFSSMTESVTCNLCLEEVSIDASCRMVMGAHGCRSSILLSPAIGWLENPTTINVIKHLSNAPRTTTLNAIKSKAPVDQFVADCNKLKLSKSELHHGELLKIDLPDYLASVVCSVAAKCAESSRLGMCLFSELLNGIRSTKIVEKEHYALEDNHLITNKYAIGSDLIDQLLNNPNMTQSHSHSRSITSLDSWYPRSLVTSRDPVAEEGSFLSFCSHPMHANCKTKYARQIKARVDHVNRNRTSSLLVYDFRCPLCKSISTIDIPLLAPIYHYTPTHWLRSRLIFGNNISTEMELSKPVFKSSGYMSWSSWLHCLRDWLNELPVIGEYDQTMSEMAISHPSTHKGDYSLLLHDYTLNNFMKLVFQLTKLQSCYAKTSSHECSKSQLVDHELTLQLVNSVLARLKTSLLVRDATDDTINNASCSKSVPKQTTITSDKSLVSPAVNLLSRQFWSGRRFGRRISSLCGTSGKLSTSQSSSTSNTLGSNGFSTLSNLLPSPPEPPYVITNLFTFVQRLSSMCHPKSVESLVQRPIGRRTTSTDASSTNTDIAMMHVNEMMNEGEDVRGLGSAHIDAEIHFNTFNNFPLIDNMIQREYNESYADNSSVTIPTPPSPVPTTVVSLGQTIMNRPSTSGNQQSTGPILCSAASTDTISSLSEAIDILHLDLMNLYERLRTLESLVPATLNYLCAPTSPNIDCNTPPSPQDTSSTMLNHNPVRLALDRVSQSARTVIRSAACEWRALRHTVSYTLTVTERNLRMKGSTAHFFNNNLTERRRYGLSRLLRVSFLAHSRHAVVSRCCSSACKHNANISATNSGSNNITTAPITSNPNGNFCQLQLLNHPTQWWWWSYCVPYETIRANISDVFSVHCRLSGSTSVLNLAESAVRVAVTEDARILWSLLLPRLEMSESTKCPKHNSTVYDESLVYVAQSDPSNRPAAHPQNDSTMQHQPSTSILWEADITFLFISLLHLRPGLETVGMNDCQCTRLAKAADQAAATEPFGSATLGSHLLACDHGRPRQPIGDCHEAHLVRLCYTALLVQSLLSWEPNSSCVDFLKQNNLLSEDFELESDTILSSRWSSSQLLLVWRLLRDLSGLPTRELPNLDPSSKTFAHLAASLGLYLRATSLPFLRIAAFVIHEITGVDVPSDLSISKETIIPNSLDEHALLLAYLGLPTGPSDLLAVLSTDKSDIPDLYNTQLGISPSFLSTTTLGTCSPHSTDDRTLSQLSESLWLARLITSWCLTGRSALSRQFYLAFMNRFPEKFGLSSQQRSQDAPHIMDLLPYPKVALPHLIPLPYEYTALLLLALDLDCHAQGHTHSDMSLCLICGHLACLFCYSCHQFEHNHNTNKNSTTNHVGSSTNHNNNEFTVYRMQVHSRHCHAGYSLLLRINACRVLLLSDQARRLTEIPAPYRDSFGETDSDLRRGNPLYLNQVEYERLNQAWVNHHFAANSTSELVTPSNLLFGLY